MNEKYLDQYGGFTKIKGEKTGFFHFEEIDGRYWFVTPEGNAFFAIALSHLFSGDSNLACENVYGGDADAWLEDTFKKGKAMGFNCALGSATSPERNLNGFVDMEKAEKVFRKNNFPFAVGVIVLKHPWEFVDGETLPDIYEPSYKLLIEKRAKEVCPKYKDDPLMMGYYYGFGAFNHSDNWVNHHMSLPAGSSGRNNITDLLIERYNNDVVAFNEVYGMKLEAISDLKDKEVLVYEKELDSRNYPSVRKKINKNKLDDFEAIISDMSIILYKTAHDAIKKWDTNHLIFGNFLKEWVLSKQSWKEVAPYVDLIAPQHINREISLDDLSKAVNMPMIISDDDTGWYYIGGISAHCGMISHEARGEVYKANLMHHYKDPLVMGVSYCACMFDQGGPILEKKQQNGYYDLNGNPRENLINTVTKINKAVYDEATKLVSSKELKEYENVFFETWDKYIAKK